MSIKKAERSDVTLAASKDPMNCIKSSQDKDFVELGNRQKFLIN